MSAELQWMLIRDNNSFLVKRSGIAFSKEPSNLVKKHSFKYCGLVQPSLVVESTPSGDVSIRRQRTKVPANKVAAYYPEAVVIKKGADAGSRAAKISKDMQSVGFRMDLVRAAQARVSALLNAAKPRKTYVKKMRANKLAKLSKKD